MILCLERGWPKQVFLLSSIMGIYFLKAEKEAELKQNCRACCMWMAWIESEASECKYSYFFFSSKLPIALPASWPTGLQICAHWHLNNTMHKAAAYWESIPGMAGSHFFCSKNIVGFIFSFIHRKHIFIHMGSMFKIIKAWATRMGCLKQSFWARFIKDCMFIQVCTLCDYEE